MKRDLSKKRASAVYDDLIKCKHCGHTQLVAYDKRICNWCGKYVYKNDLIEFRDKLKISLIKQKNNN